MATTKKQPEETTEGATVATGDQAEQQIGRERDSAPMPVRLTLPGGHVRGAFDYLGHRFVRGGSFVTKRTKFQQRRDLEIGLEVQALTEAEFTQAMEARRKAAIEAAEKAAAAAAALQAERDRLRRAQVQG